MRIALAVLALLDLRAAAVACPRHDADFSGTRTDAPATVAPCITNIDWSAVRSLLEVRYGLGVGGSTRSGIGGVGTVFASLELAYALQFGSDPAQPSYEVELAVGGAAQRYTGAVEASALTTRASLRLGPARLAPAVIDHGRGNLATFPMTLELAHTGEVAARPRISARPELARGLYSRERVELATRLVRAEAAGSTQRPGEDAKPASAWAIDLFPLHGGVDVALQDAARVETSVGGALMAVVEHSRNAKLDLLGIEHRRIDVAPMSPASFLTVWILRLDAVDERTGTSYTLGWGAAAFGDDMHDFAYAVDPEGAPAIGGAGWYFHRAWGGFGLQYRRDIYAAMTGELGLEDRVSGEVYVPRLLDGVVRGFAAQTTRLAGDRLVRDTTAGVELAASYTHAGYSARVGVELGRTFYTALDDALPETAGFVASVGLTMQHAGRWQR